MSLARALASPLMTAKASSLVIIKARALDSALVRAKTRAGDTSQCFAFHFPNSIFTSFFTSKSFFNYPVDILKVV